MTWDLESSLVSVIKYPDKTTYRKRGEYVNMIPKRTVYCDGVLWHTVPGGGKGVDVIPEGTAYHDGVLCDIVPGGGKGMDVISEGTVYHDGVCVTLFSGAT